MAFAKVWIDGIVGIGGKGALRGNLAEAVEQLNEYSILMRPAIVSIDVPSGLTDDEGSVKGAVMRATHTMAVGSFKRARSCRRRAVLWCLGTHRDGVDRTRWSDPR